MSAGGGSSSNSSLVDLVGATSAQVFVSKGYLISSGFQNKAGASKLQFSINPLSINFGELIAGREHAIPVLITGKSAETAGFKLYASQNRPLSTESGAEIVDTVCDAIKKKFCSVN